MWNPQAQHEITATTLRGRKESDKKKGRRRRGEGGKEKEKRKEEKSTRPILPQLAIIRVAIM